MPSRRLLSLRIKDEIQFGPRLLVATIGIIAGNAVLLMYLLISAAQVRAALLKTHMGEPDRQFAAYWDGFLIFAFFAIVGWIIVGIPVALTFPARLTRIKWWPVPSLLIGAALGQLALLVVFTLMAALQGNLREFRLPISAWKATKGDATRRRTTTAGITTLQIFGYR